MTAPRFPAAGCVVDRPSRRRAVTRLLTRPQRTTRERLGDATAAIGAAAITCGLLRLLDVFHLIGAH